MGKSTIAQALLKSTSYGERSTYCSADDYFVDLNGNYNFSREKLGKAHAECQAKFRNAILNECEVIVVDNTNVRRRDFAFYVHAAREAGYKLYEITVGSLDVEVSYTRNAHNVPLESIESMAKSFER